MIWFLSRRLVAMALTFWAMTFVAFLVMELPPGDYATTKASEMTMGGAKVDQAMVLRMREMYNLDGPVLVRYATWFGRVIRGDLGYSLAYSTPVNDLISHQLPNTLLIDGLTLLLTWAIAIPIGIYSAVRQYSVGDYVATVLGFIGVAVPTFLIALLLMWFAYINFGVVLGGLHSQEFSGNPWTGPALLDLLSNLWAPILIGGASGMASLIRVTRANLLDELHKPYVVTARAKGLGEWQLILKYPVRMALSPLVSSLGWLLPSLLSTSTIVGIVMNLPTLGPLLLNALLVQDMFLAGGVLVVMAILTLVGTLLSDLLLFWLDPRVRIASL